MPQDVDVLVVGAGPTGLTMASELIRRGLRVRIVDQNERPTNQSRALGLHSRTLEIFEKMGVLDTMLEQGLPIDHLQIYQNGRCIGSPSLSVLNAPYPFILILPQANTEKILNTHLESLGGKVERPTQIVRVQENQAFLNHPDGKQEVIEAKWIIGCDGAHSTVRSSLNTSFKGSGFSEGFGLADVSAETSLSPTAMHAFVGPKGLFLVFPLPLKNQFRLIAVLPQGFNEKALTREYLENLACERASTPFRIQNVIWSSIFFVNQRIVPRMRKGSVFLCGDAAHVHSPAGGQGLNISVQDAFNLAWKLSLVHHNQAPESLLDTYHEERYPIAKDVIKGTTIATYFLTTRSKALRFCFFKLMARLLKIPRFRRHFAYAVSELSTHYKRSSIVSQPLRDIFWKGPKPGTRAPILDNPEELRHILLIFGAPDFTPELPLKLLCPKHIELKSPIALAYKATKPCLYLLRPDGYVAFRTGCIDPKSLNIFLSKIFIPN